MRIVSKVTGFFKNIITYWKHPREGEFVPNKEIFNMALGCAGGILVDAVELTFTAGFFLVGAIYKINFRDIFIIGLINVPFTLIFSPLNMIVTDNLGKVPRATMKRLYAILFPSMALGLGLMFMPNSFLENIIPAFPKILGWAFLWNAVNILKDKLIYQKLSPRFGKFRVWVIAGCLPSFAIMMLIVYLPFLDFQYPERLFILNMLFSVFNTFKSFTGQRSNIQNVISPNSAERVKINTVNTIIVAPIYGIRNSLVPILATLTGGLTNYNTYRILTPIFYAIGIPLMMFLAFGVKDRIIIEKNHVANINMFSGIKQALKNKYLWLLYISDNSQGIAQGAVVVINVVIVYMLRQDWLLGILVTVTGFFGFPGVFLAPILIKKIGKKNVLLLAKGLYFSYFILAFLAVKLGSLPILLVGIVLGNVFLAAGYIARDTMGSDMWDYQQYISGKRLESSLGILNTLGSPIVNLLYMTIPTVYAMIGFTNDWNMLYVPEIRNQVLNATLLIGAIAYALGALPIFFYDLTEKKHREIICALQNRKQQLEDSASCLPTDNGIAPEAQKGGISL